MAKVLSKGEHTTLRLIDSSTVTKTATDEGVEKLAKEIDFLMHNKSELHYRFLPDILSYEVTEQRAYYSMPYLSGPLLRDYIYSESSFPLCEQNLETAIANLDSLHRESGKIASAEFSSKYYLDRLSKRWNKLQDNSKSIKLGESYSVDNISSDDVESLFSFIARGAVLSIDGKDISFSFERLIDTFILFEEVFEVPQTSIRLIHGDPHAGNILLHDHDAILLDPNGFMDGGDVAYDFGKLLVSFDWHDLSMLNMIEPVKINITTKGMRITNNRTYKDKRIEMRHKSLRKKILKLLDERVVPLYENDPLLLQRIKLLLYIHQFSFAPTLIKEKPRTALHILLNAISDYTTLIEEDTFNFS